jgi:hypothetical protein
MSPAACKLPVTSSLAGARNLASGRPPGDRAISKPPRFASREPGLASSAGNCPSKPASASGQTAGSDLVGLASSRLAERLAAKPPLRPTADGDRLAPQGLAALLVVEIRGSGRPAASQRRRPRAHRTYVSGQPPLGYRAHPWRTPQARNRSQQPIDPQIPVERSQSSGSQKWRSFLSNELKGIWGADLFVVQTVGFRTLYVFFFITHARRELVQFNLTASPTAAWIWQQVINATPWGRPPRYLIHDRDAVYGDQFDARLLLQRRSSAPEPLT